MTRSQPVGRRLLVRFRVMAFTTATLLIILVFVGIPLQLAAGRPGVVNVVGTMHGFLYLIYLYVAFELTRKLGVPKWQMLLVLLAGTMPFCAFVAERKLTRRFEAQRGESGPSGGTSAGASRSGRAASIRRRWLSKRALLLHLEVTVVAPGCAVAGWWQATRALAGNGLSWFYSVEWPVFALLAIGGWWHLIHEDPAAYRARRQSSTERRDSSARIGAAGVLVPSGNGVLTAPDHEAEVVWDAGNARLSAALAVAVAAELLLGIMALLSVPYDRPSGWLPAKGEAVYLAHAGVGLLLSLGAAVFLFHVRDSTRTDRFAGWIGLFGLALAGLGGLLTEAQSLPRFLGMALMFVGPMTAGLGYLIPVLHRLQHKASPLGVREPGEAAMSHQRPPFQD